MPSSITPEVTGLESGAFNAFADLAILSRTESWKYTSLDFLKSREMVAANSDVGVPPPLTDYAFRMVFVNGVLSPSHSSDKLPAGFRIGNGLTSGTLNTQPVARLNSVSAKQIALLGVETGMHMDRPVEIVFCGSGEFHNQLGLTVDAGTSATIIERHFYDGPCTTTTLSWIEVAQGAKLKHYRLHEGAEAAVSLATSLVTLSKDSTYEAFSLTLGGQVTRHQVQAELTAFGSHLELNGAHILSGDSHADTTTEIRHMAPHCASRETYRHVMDGTARSVFQGKIHVSQDAQKTDGFQLNQSLMLSPQAEVDAKPELEIYADDVKCSHGATSGRLDEDALFYLRSRGLTKAGARAMLVDAFIGSAIDLISDEPVREAFHMVATKALNRDTSDAQ